MYFLMEQVTLGHVFLKLLWVSQVCYRSMDIPYFPTIWRIGNDPNKDGISTETESERTPRIKVEY
jgi:hypothetical protein